MFFRSLQMVVGRLRPGDEPGKNGDILTSGYLRGVMREGRTYRYL